MKRTYSPVRRTSSVTSLPSAEYLMQTPMVERTKRALRPRQFQYSGLMVTSFLLAALLPFGLAPSGGTGRGKRGADKSGKKSRRKERRVVDDEPHDLDSKSRRSNHSRDGLGTVLTTAAVASESNHQSKSPKLAAVGSQAPLSPQIHANHRSGSSLRSTNGSSYRPRRNSATPQGRVKKRERQTGAQKRADKRTMMRRQGWR